MVVPRMTPDAVPLDVLGGKAAPPRGAVELVVDGEHYARVVREGIGRAKVSIDIATADLKAMLVPEEGGSGAGRSASNRRRRAPSVIHLLRQAAKAGVEVRLLHAGVPTSGALHELRKGIPPGLILRRCPRLHAKTVIIDSTAMMLGSANLTGAGLGAKAPHRRNFEWSVWTESAELIDAVLARFNAIWEGDHCEGCGRRDVCPEPLEEPDIATK